MKKEPSIQITTRKSIAVPPESSALSPLQPAEADTAVIAGQNQTVIRDDLWERAYEALKLRKGNLIQAYEQHMK